MPNYSYRCENCGHKMEFYFELDKRKNKVTCEKCNGLALRTYEIGTAYIRKNYLGDIWEKENIEPVRDGRDLEAKRKNNERVKRMREQSRINLERERAKKKQ